MKLSEENKKKICEEIRFVIEKMKESKDMDKSLYFLSGIHSMLSRVYNFEFHRHLVFIHFVLANCHISITRAIEIARQGKQPIIIDLNFFSKLIDLLGELANVIEGDKSTFDVLEKICVLVYSITGNGYYLQQKGIKVIDF
jgi:sugar/nucleoside kinase (ribokinase family)